MQFWSKGLGKKTIQLNLAKGESMTSRGRLYLRGQMEAPVSWEYIMPMGSDDIVDFFALLKEPTIAAFVHRSPRRWRLYGTMLAQGLQLAVLVVAYAVRALLGRTPAESPVTIEVPPASVLKKRRGKKAAAAARRPYRRRLGVTTTHAPSLSQGMKQQAFDEDDEDSVEDAIREAMEAAAALE